MENDSINGKESQQAKAGRQSEDSPVEKQKAGDGRFFAPDNPEAATSSTRQLISLIQKNVGQAAQNELLAIFKSLSHLKEELRAPHQIDVLQQIQYSASAIMNLIHNAMVFSLQKPCGITLAPELWSMRADLGRLFSQYSFRARQKGLSLRLNISSELPDSYLTDPARIGQIVANFLDNAIKFSDAGQVSLNVEQLSKDPEETRIRLSVIDSGRGLSEEQIDSILHDCPPQGPEIDEICCCAGLGLMINRIIVKKMGGTLGVKSSPGIGSEFWVTLPLKNFQPAMTKTVEKTADVSAADTVSAPEKTHSPRILVVDDVEINRKVVGVLLKGLGITSEYASNGKIALEMAQNKDYDLILMDCIMPEMDGFASAEAIRASETGRRHRAMIVALTSHDLEGTRNRCLRAGMDECLYKPIQTEDLRKILKALPAKVWPVE